MAGSAATPAARRAAVLLWIAGAALLAHHFAGAGGPGPGASRALVPIGASFLIGAGCWLGLRVARALAYVFSAVYGGALAVSAFVMLAGRAGPYAPGALAFAIAVGALVLGAGVILVRESMAGGSGEGGPGGES